MQTRFSDDLKNKSSPKYQELETKVKRKISVLFYDYFHFKVILLLQFFFHNIIYQLWLPLHFMNYSIHYPSLSIVAFCTHLDENRSHCSPPLALVISVNKLMGDWKKFAWNQDFSFTLILSQYVSFPQWTNKFILRASKKPESILRTKINWNDLFINIKYESPKAFSAVSHGTLFIDNFHNTFGTVIVPKQYPLTIPLSLCSAK